jgi:hypothetical protein
VNVRVVGAAAALGVRRAARTWQVGAARVQDAASEARTGASIRGSSMAGCDVAA